jgi:hypothetical protein
VLHEFGKFKLGQLQAKQQMDGEGIFEYPDGRKYEGLRIL